MSLEKNQPEKQQDQPEKQQEKQQEKQLHESITVQGLSNIFDKNSNHFRRIFWLLILCGGIAFTAFNIYTQVTLYLSVPVSIRIDQLLAKRLPFPTITICNSNFITKTAIVGTGLMPIIPVFLPYKDFVENTTELNFTHMNFDAIFSQDDPTSSWEAMTHYKNETIIRCAWESGPCNIDNFTTVFTDTGVCFTFNVDGSLLARNSGRSHGFRVLLDVQEYEYVRSSYGDVSTGFLVAIHAPEVSPLMQEVGMSVAPGLLHSFGIEVKSQTAKDGISGCGTRSLNFTSAKYSRQACRIECRGNYLVEKCACKGFFEPNNASICSPDQVQDCLMPAMEEYLQTGTGCEENCPEPCSFTSFSTQHSSAPLSRDYVIEYTKVKGQTEEYWRKNMVILEVYMTSMTFQMMEKRLSYEILDLFCDIGGALGLLLGATILTLLELIDFCLTKSLSRLLMRNISPTE